MLTVKMMTSSLIEQELGRLSRNINYKNSSSRIAGVIAIIVLIVIFYLVQRGKGAKGQKLEQLELPFSARPYI